MNADLHQDNDPSPLAAPAFEWEYEGRIVVLDNGARMPTMPAFDRLMALNAFAVVVLDPASILHANKNIKELPEFQVFGHATLGSGEDAVLYACMDPLESATLEPVIAGDLSERTRLRRKVVAQLPISTLRLDAIEGLDHIDWLLLDDRNDILAALEHGTRALAHTSLVDIRIPFRDAYAGQSRFLQAIPWMQAHGFSFHGFANVGHKSLLPEGKFFAKNKATRWEWADAIFLPDAARLAGMDNGRTTKLACVVDLAYGMHDLAAELLGRLDSDTASRYLDARGYVSPYFKEPDTFTLTVANAPVPWQDLKIDNPLPHAEGEPA
ncbi:MAG TPA: hypothetical protein VJ833_10650 [Rhodanobacteraceae bacterium]|nr:hypothetical protein [Rhodanobacteraceae bacterium]